MSVMNLLHLEHIIETILSDVPCPSCGEPLNEELINIQNIQPKQVDIFAPCHNCGSRISICADIQENSPETLFRVLLPRDKESSFTTKISPHNVQEISQSLQNFKERDVRKLF